MTFDLAPFQPQLEALCVRYGVTRLEAFGSVMTDAFDEATSDLDFLVVFEDDLPELLFDRYFGLREDLMALFGRKIDLVELRAIRNPYFLEHINRNRSVLYAS